MRRFLLGSIAILILFGITGCGLSSSPAQHLAKETKQLRAATTARDRFYALGHVAKDSFDAGKFKDARKYTLELQKMTPDFKGDWNYGNAIEDVNIVLGRLAVRDGKVSEARKYLTAAGNSPGSPQMDSFGPNMSLAQDMLKKGETKAVLDYFVQCRTFWKTHLDVLDDWADDVKHGRTPNFGANLTY